MWKTFLSGGGFEPKSPEAEKFVIIRWREKMLNGKLNWQPDGKTKMQDDRAIIGKLGQQNLSGIKITTSGYKGFDLNILFFPRIPSETEF